MKKVQTLELRLSVVSNPVNQPQLVTYFTSAVESTSTIEKFEKEAKNIGKADFKHAWDKLKCEREGVSLP